MPEGRQSPPPERQSAAQVGDTGSGKASDISKTSQKDPKSQLDCLTSNPKGPMDDVLKHKFSREPGNYTPLNA
ncbi:hypothetical protein THAR02_06826 [Trichoderma harzianum]|uniref:Uncharacterized protein n=1 Tax=Trichoderma harzianum TaxID=5544 RepID=A0A0G0A7J7_TRIHA|nr:hypothetical protein THAR02_06826 [Trichoderma harzianum]